jgi:hypothetical protein
MGWGEGERADGDIDFRQQGELDENGNLLVGRQDFDGDGTFDLSGTATYGCREVEGETQCVRQTTSIDTDGDDTVDYYEEWTYDERWNLTAFDIDVGNDDSLEYTQSTEWIVWNDNDLFTRFERDGELKPDGEQAEGDRIATPADGNVDVVVTRTWDCLDRFNEE